MKLRAGIDIGSVTTKCVIVANGTVVGKSLIRTAVDSEAAGEQVLAGALKEAGVKEADLDGIISTGYGRRRFKKSGRVVTEITAAGYGAFVAHGRKPCLVIDVGGQDTKVIEVNAQGEVVDFLMNDKCAAGTGRFLEMMAGVLESDLEGLSALALESSRPVAINATCTVFAESEVVSLIAHAAAREDIAAGIFRAIASRISTMAGHFGEQPCTVFCGGGARSAALKRALEASTGRTITVLPDPQFVIAFGAAIL